MKVPKSMIAKYEEIAPFITGFCDVYLNEEYAAVSLLMLEKLCRKRPSPLLGGKPRTWACGIIYTVGSNNFLFDKTQSPYMRASALAEKFGLRQSSAGNKSSEIKRLLNIGVFDPEWTLPSKLWDNPMVWMFETSNGFVFDARNAPRGIQEDLFDEGLIPFIPADRIKTNTSSEETQEEERSPPKIVDISEKKREHSVIEGQFSFFDDTQTPAAKDAEPPTKQPLPIVTASRAASVKPLVSIEDYCGNNRDFMQILSKFSDGYSKVYNKRDVASRDELKMYIRRNFNTWYISGVNPVFQISPARFINSDISYKFGDGVVAVPVCGPAFKKNKLSDISYTFHVYTLDDHPFIRDMHLFLESAKSISIESTPGDAYDCIFTYAISNFASITENAEFTFKERPYIVALSDVCERLSLIALSATDRGITFFQNEIDAFFSMPGREKFGRVVDVLIDRFVECISDVGLSGRQPDADDVLDVLQEENEVEGFMGSLFDDLFDDLADDMRSLTDESMDPYELLESLEGARVEELLKAHAVISACCSHFFTIFGQYLQMILPEHFDPFVFCQTDDDYLEALENEVRDSDDPDFKMRSGAMHYYILPGGYGITPLGADWFGIDLSGQDDRFSPPVLPGYYKETLDGMLENDFEGAVDRFMSKVLRDPDQADNLVSMFEDIFGDDAQGLLDELNLYGDQTDG